MKASAERNFNPLSYGFCFAMLALIGAILATIGDAGQLWCVNAARVEFGLMVPPDWVIVIGTLMGAIGIPLYGFGYILWGRLLQSKAVAFIGTAYAVLGGIVHATTGVRIASTTDSIANGSDPIHSILASGPIVVSLWAFAGIAFVAVSICAAFASKSIRARLLQPLPITLFLSALALLVPLPWRDFLAPASINIAHVIFFAGLVAKLWKNREHFEL